MTPALPVVPERLRPGRRRAIFLDVENTSKPQHLAHVLDHLAVDQRDARTELVGVANWRVVGQDSARFLSQRGAHLVHSAPSVGVSDWSDLRIAVAAGIWLAEGRPGDLIEIVSDDRAFDAVGDVAASLGIEFRRLSYRRLAQEHAGEIGPAPRATGRSRRDRRPGGVTPSSHTGAAPERWHSGPASSGPRPPPAPVRRAHVGPLPAAPPARPAPAASAQTAPRDELVSVVRDLVEASPGIAVGIDVLANVLKARGFQRPTGSPRLVTRLRRIPEILVSPSGMVTLAKADSAPSPGTAVIRAREDGRQAIEARHGPVVPELTEQPPGGSHRRGRRRRRGGRRRRIERAASA
jgi:hypothetical protein